MATNSGDLVQIKNSSSGEVVYTGHLLGSNARVFIGMVQPYLTDPESYVVSNFDDLKHFAIEEVSTNLVCWMNGFATYVSFDCKTHTIEVIQSNTTPFKANPVNDIYNFKTNRWGLTTESGHYADLQSFSDNPLPPVDNVIIESIGSENIYLIINGLHCCFKCPNINNYKQLGIGMYNLVQDPNNPDYLNAVLVKPYETKLREDIFSNHAA